MNARPRFQIFPDPETLAARAARWLAKLARAKTGDFAIALSGGSTPRLLYRTLAAPPYLKSFPWERVHWFWGDERFVARDNPMSNFKMAWDAMLSQAPAPSSHIHAVDCAAPSAAEAARLYERELQRYYGGERLRPERPLFDVNLLGLGADGHTASLFPDSPALLERKRWVAAVEGQTPERVTLTYPALESAAHTAFLVTGGEKRAVLRRLWQGGDDMPAAKLKPVGELLFFVDADAAG
ncbi:MAG TPA: 6-phosphogluconolactonase [Rhizomicrobium sp.]|nr:6-phosphogluconolactonase [Rhizomicrobium sp.]